MIKDSFIELCDAYIEQQQLTDLVPDSGNPLENLISDESNELGDIFCSKTTSWPAK